MDRTTYRAGEVGVDGDEKMEGGDRERGEFLSFLLSYLLSCFLTFWEGRSAAYHSYHTMPYHTMSDDGAGMAFGKRYHVITGATVRRTQQYIGSFVFLRP